MVAPACPSPAAPRSGIPIPVAVAPRAKSKSNSAVRIGSCRAPRIISSPSQDEVFEKSLLHVQAVFRLVEDGRLRPVDHARRDLLSAMRRQAVEHDGMRGR